MNNREMRKMSDALGRMREKVANGGELSDEEMADFLRKYGGSIGDRMKEIDQVCEDLGDFMQDITDKKGMSIATSAFMKLFITFVLNMEKNHPEEEMVDWLLQNLVISLKPVGYNIMYTRQK